MAASKDAYFRQEGNCFRIGTACIEKKLELTADGRLILRSLRDVRTGKEYVRSASVLPDEFFATVNGAYRSGAGGAWTLEETKTQILSQGELETVIALRDGDLTVERHYVAYPGLAVLQEWTVYRNGGKTEMRLTRPSLCVQRLLGERNVDFAYMTGGANFTGSQILKTVPLTDGFTKDFDSQANPEIIPMDGVEGNTWHPRLNGAGVWNEFFALTDTDEKEGLFLTFDYQGWWKAGMTDRDRDRALTGWCELLEYPVAPGEEVRIAPMALGLYHGDLDDMGNAIAEYIYTYKWDYTRDKYFNRTSLSIWQAAPLTDRVFEMVRAARYIGYERLWVDDFWFDAKGNWNGIFGDDWNEVCRYLKEQGMLFRLWMPPWHADRLSNVWVEHPDWMLDFHGNWYNWTIDMSKEEAYQWVLRMLGEKQKEFGSYDLRVDGDPCNLWGSDSFDQADKNGSWNGTLKQSENFYRLYKEFKDQNPDAGLDGCSSGGHTLGIESVRYTDQQQITDGYCFHMGGYWTTMILPIDKHQGMNLAGTDRRGGWQAEEEDPGQMNLFSAPVDGMQHPERPVTPAALEARRKNLELFYWLRRQGVYGRWIRVYRPRLEYGDETFLLQRMTWDQKKGLVMISASELNPLHGKSARIYPKGLLPEEEYRIEARLGGMEPAVRTGKQWMEEGIALTKVQPGEYLFLNLTGRPGQGTLTAPPAAPADPVKTAETWLRRDGVALRWKAAEDENVSTYEIERGGAFYTKISIGSFCFVDGGSLSESYRVRSVDFDGNASEWVNF